MPERVDDTAKLAKAMEWTPSKPIAGSREALLDRLEGIMVGPNPAEGVFVEGVFLHPELDFRLAFPSEWKTQNQAQFVIAIPPESDGKTAIVLALAEGGADPVEAARADKLDESAMKELERTQINGLRAARVVTEKSGSSFELTCIAHGERV